MTYAVRFHASVSDDIAATAAYLAEHGSQEIADRFVSQAVRACGDLAHMPGKGSPKSFRSRPGTTIRTWAVPTFPNHLIFYVAASDHVRILAILHGSRDVQRILRERR
jgi:plasmid stabilization system protein ParE